MMKRIALVTGSCSGIGFATARRLLQIPGTEVIVSGLTKEDIEQARQMFGDCCASIHYILIDVRDDESVESAARKLEASVGLPDILINCAAIMPPFEPVAEEPDFFTVKSETISRVFDTNAVGIFRMCRTFVPSMLNKGYGRIVNVSSEAGSLTRMLHDPWPYSPSYRISKTAVNAITRLLAKQLNGTNVLVNSVCPGWVRTRMGGEKALLSPEQATETILHLAQLGDDGPNGGFWSDMRPYGFPNTVDW